MLVMFVYMAAATMLLHGHAEQTKTQHAEDELKNVYNEKTRRGREREKKKRQQAERRKKSRE